MIAHGRGTMRALSSLIGILVSLELWVPAMAQSPLSAGRERALKPGDTFKECDACPEMVVVPAGSFAMGSPNNEKARDNNEGPQHQVTITRSFAFGKFEVTVDQFVAFVQETGHDTGSTCDIWQDGKWAERSGYSWRKPGFAQSGSHPAACLSWDDAKAYLSWLSRKTGKIYRLPAEAEWEYAARAGTTTRFYFGDDSKDTAGMATGPTKQLGTTFLARRAGASSLAAMVTPTRLGPAASRPTDLGSMTRSEMSLNGPRIAGTTATRARPQTVRLGRAVTVISASNAAVPGAILRTISARRSAAGNPTGTVMSMPAYGLSERSPISGDCSRTSLLGRGGRHQLVSCRSRPQRPHDRESGRAGRLGRVARRRPRPRPGAAPQRCRSRRRRA